MKSQMDSWIEGVTFMAQRLENKKTFSAFVGPMTLDWVRKFLANTHLQYEFSVKTDPRRPAEWKIIIKYTAMDLREWYKFQRRVLLLDHCETCGPQRHLQFGSFRCWKKHKDVPPEAFKRCRLRKRFFNDFTLPE